MTDVARIVAIRNPVLRNLSITCAYSSLAGAVAARCGAGANWCTFATWASRQAGATIRGEDALDLLMDRLGGGSWLHPLRSFGRWLLRRGLFDRSSRLGRLTARFHTPFDAVELASDAVARGNLKVFEEIGDAFARWVSEESLSLRDGDPPSGQRLLRSAFELYSRSPGPQELLLANLLIGLHEQTRLQPEIAEALGAADVTREELGRRLCPGRRPRVQRAAALVASPVQSRLAALSRELITSSLMVLWVPGRLLLLGRDLDDPFPSSLGSLSDAALVELVARFEPAGSGARDWSDLAQRMRYIVHLFRAFAELRSLSDPPFTAAQIASIERGVIPDGDL